MEPFQLLFFLATLMFVAGTAITLVRKKLLKNHAQEIGKLSISIEGKENENQLLKQQNSQIKQDFAVLSAENREREKSNLEKITLLKDAENSLKIKFENLANQIFTENQKNLRKQIKKALKHFCIP